MQDSQATRDERKDSGDRPASGATTDADRLSDRRPAIFTASLSADSDNSSIMGPPAIKARSVSSLPDDLGPEDFAAAIAETVLEFKEGDIIEGQVVDIEQDEVLVDIGYKSEGVVPLKELSIRKNVAPGDIISIGQHIEVLVLEKEDEQGRLILSKKRALYERVWGQIEAVKEQGGTVKGTVIEVVKGGLIVDIGLRGFLPASLVDLRRVRDLEPFIGQDIEAKVIELDRNRNNVVLSRRAYLEEAQAEQRSAFLDALEEGETRSGVVSSVVNFGAFVDLGGMDGLVHVSELSWQHVNHPSEVVKVGQKVSIKVLEIDLNRERISLSIKQTTPDPWQAFSTKHEVGVVIEGTVIKTVPFGAFVGVGNGVEGLVHVSEIAMHRVESPELELSIGQMVKVKLTEMDEARRRVSFSIKQALPEFSSRHTGHRSPRRRRPAVAEFERAEKKEETRTFDVDASLEAILQELKERGIGRR
jgi:small subunit ribosomal protein S1